MHPTKTTIGNKNNTIMCAFDSLVGTLVGLRLASLKGSGQDVVANVPGKHLTFIACVQ